MQIIVTVNLPVTFSLGKEGKACYRKTIVGDDVLRYQMNRSVDDRPAWILDPKTWKKMSPQDKLRAFVETFNLGWGVSYECVE